MTRCLFTAIILFVKRSTILAELRRVLLWLKPGVGIKRWMVMILFGITLLGLGFAILLLDLYRTESTNETLLTILSYASLRFWPRALRALVFGGVGIGLVVFGFMELNRSLMRPFIRPGSSLAREILSFNRLEKGPRVVAIGGGHGLASLLRGLKEHTHNITAVVTVADDGGSSGRLRESLGILPPGDIRNCLAALSNDEAMLTQLFQYRFSGVGGLDGHSFGNLFITALSELTGSMEEAVAESGRVLSVHGRVLPSTLHDVRLVADMRVPHSLNEVRVEGESRIPQMAGRVRRVWLEPNDASAFPPVIKALLRAELIVVGPGSLYTSILPNLLVQDVIAAMHSSRATKIFICNIATQSGETDAYSCYDHVRALEEHVGEDLFDIVLCNDKYIGTLDPSSQFVRVDERTLADSRVYTADLVNDDNPWRHDSAKLSEVIINLYNERTGPLSDRME
ncbi:MAG: uridine diphosphate-N-acetylglucosamine-binding protein YvcK [Chloroflexota bacterium]